MNLWNTRPKDEWGENWNRRLEAAGFHVVHVPTVRVEIPEENPGLCQAWEDFLAPAGRKHLLLTSPRALEALSFCGLEPKEPLFIWAVGEGTARKAKELGWGEVTYPQGRAGEEAAGREVLLPLLQKGFSKGDHLFWPRSSLSPLSSVMVLKPVAGLLLAPVAYRIVEGAEGGGEEEAREAARWADAALCASPSAVRGLQKAVGPMAPPVIPWGGTTREEVRRLGLSLAEEGLIHRVRRILQSLGGR